MFYLPSKTQTLNNLFHKIKLAVLILTILPTRIKTYKWQKFNQFKH